MLDMPITFAEITMPALDAFALLWFITGWLGYMKYADYKSRTEQTLAAAVDRYRLDWMRQMLKRDNRITDTTTVANLQRSISFFSSTTIIILLGLMASLSHKNEIMHTLSELPYAQESESVWQIKVMLLIVIFIYAFFKYTWSLRQYNYLSIFITAAPLPGQGQEDIESMAQRAAQLSGNAGRHFNLGLRAYYFGLAALSWFINAWVFAIATAWVVYVLYRREFRSHTLSYLK